MGEESKIYINQRGMIYMRKASKIYINQRGKAKLRIGTGNGWWAAAAVAALTIQCSGGRSLKTGRRWGEIEIELTTQ